MAVPAARSPRANRAARRPRAVRGPVPPSAFRHGPSHRGGPADPGSDAGRRPDRGSVPAARREKPAVRHGNRAGMAPAPAEALLRITRPGRRSPSPVDAGGWRKHHPPRVIPPDARPGLLMAHTPAPVRPADGAAWTTTT